MTIGEKIDFKPIVKIKKYVSGQNKPEKSLFLNFAQSLTISFILALCLLFSDHLYQFMISAGLIMYKHLEAALHLSLGTL